MWDVAAAGLVCSGPSQSRSMSWETVLWSLVPTPGHLAGSMSRLIRPPQRSQLVLVGDLTSGAEPLGRGQLPGVGVAVSWSRPPGRCS